MVATAPIPVAQLVTPVKTVPANVLKIADVQYGPQPWQKLNVYRPAAAGSNRRMIIFVHGGSWMNGNKEGLEVQSIALAQAGFVVFPIDYRLATMENPGWPTQVTDIGQATGFVQAWAAKYTGSATKLGLLGASAGANLVLEAGEIMNTATHGRIKAVASLSAPTDLYAMTKATLAAGGTGEGSGLDAYLGCTLASCPDNKLKNASPFYRLDAYSPNFFIMHSEGEFIPVQWTRDFVTKARGLGDTVQTRYLTGSLHAMKYWDQVQSDIISYFNSKL